MADTKLSDLSAASSVGVNDLFYTVQTPGVGGVKATLTQLANAVLSGGPVVAGGTANGVIYLDADKKATSGSGFSYTSGQTNGLKIQQAGQENPLFLGNGTFDGRPSMVSLNGANDTSIVGIFGGGSTGYLDLSLAAPSKNIIFCTGAGLGETMRLTSTGLGIGTSAPSNAKLEVTDGSTYFQWVGRAVSNDRSINIRAETGYNASLLFTQNGVADRWAVGTKSGDGSLCFATGDSLSNGTEKMRLGSAGNLGIGVTPSAWPSSYRAFDVSTAAFVKSNNGGADIWANCYTDGSNSKYKSSLYALVFRLDAESGGFKWYTAPSGTAGDPITFTQAMTLTATGRLGIGSTSPGATFVVSNAGNLGLEFDPSASSGTVAQIEAYDRVAAAYKTFRVNALDHKFCYGSSATVGLTLDSSGNLIHTVTGTAPTLSTNGTTSMELTDNTHLKIVVRGSDGVTRSATLTLA